MFSKLIHVLFLARYLFVPIAVYFLYHWSYILSTSIIYFISFSTTCFFTKYLVRSCYCSHYDGNMVYLILSDKYIYISLFFNFCIFSLFLVDSSQTLYVNLGCFKCIHKWMNEFIFFNKTLLTILFMLCNYIIVEICLKIFFNLKLFNNLVAFCFLISL